MNVLIYVITIVMLLTALTYARIENFRAFSVVEASFNYYVTSTERIPLDLMNKDLYDSIIIRSKKAAPQTDKANQSSSRLSFYLFINKEARDNSQEAYSLTRELAKLLMANLYSNQKFYQDMVAKRPNFLNDIFDEIERSAEKQKEMSFKKTTALSKLNFDDKELQTIFYLMLHGLPKIEKTNQESVTEPLFGETSIIEKDEDSETDDELEAAAKGQESHSDAGYESLIDHITLIKATKIRVFLASHRLLTVIFGSEAAADTIIEARNLLYKKVHADEVKPEAASLEFSNAFSATGTATEFSAILDFSVSKTNPQPYN